MPLVSDAVYDTALQEILDSRETMYLCSAEPTTYDEASNTLRLGHKAAPPMTGPADGAVDGRQVSIDTFTDGSVTVTGTATHFALCDDTGQALLVVGALSASEAVTALDTWTVSSPITINLRDAA